jgi:predicted transposase/invertase (TIGR01784 family)
MNTSEKYINPFTDFGFKRLFGTEYNKALLIDFLNQVLGNREHISDLTYLNSENQGKTETDRKAVFDLYCENEKGEKFIIEVQNVKQQYFKDRSIFYATFPIQEQAIKGTAWDYSLKAVYTIGILNFSFPDESGDPDRYWREIQLMDTQTAEVFFDKLTFIYLEVPKFRKKEEDLVTHFDKWMYVLRNLSRLQEKPRRLQEKVFEQLFSEAELAKLTPEDMRTYEESQKVYWDNYSVLEYAKQEGWQEGRQEGWQEGKLEGRQEGRLEGQKAAMVLVAKAMKEDGELVERIAKLTGLSSEEITQL